MLSGWRVAAKEFSSTPDAMMSGEGAYLFGGRWNSRGVRIVYLGSSLAQASMELLMHLGRPDILRLFHKMEVFFDEEFVLHIAVDDLPEDWRKPSMVSAVQEVGDLWVSDQSSLILQVPSAAIPGEYNYLFNPLHPDTVKAQYSSITMFEYDPRLVK